MNLTYQIGSRTGSGNQFRQPIQATGLLEILKEKKMKKKVLF